MWPFNKKSNNVIIKINDIVISGNKKKTLLASCLAQGVEVKNNCGVGNCQKCSFALISGEVDTKQSQGRMLACCTFPITDIEIMSF
jgi:ferredoxin